ncbi:hypothetical protein B0T20DRAFT_451946 [Sordaria brevicollis]|uniref:Gfd2/YDR514C-like C-terminal domain-containing protein n=1 Tax=Sordaria brevicollis TaxID=83679 RepID=A0AAE0PH93_SORBR|nr:hypothetical protein B0T20DRAFT_451946 [Sordaria brevicollis]
MYSDHSDFYGDDSDLEGELPRKAKSKTTIAPPLVSSFEALQAFKNKLGEAIICAIDLETVDNHHGTELQKMSEIGIAVYDPREASKTPSNAIPHASETKHSVSNDLLMEIAKSIMAYHFLKDDWKGETEITCKAFWHKKKPHIARPYHCVFALSTIMSSSQCIESLKVILQNLTSQNLTAEERQSGHQRQVRVVFWDSGLEDKVFRQANIHLSELGHDIETWDLQAWWPFKARFSNGKNRGLARGEVAFECLGVVGAGNETILHNATNDAVAQLLAFQRMMVIGEPEWKTWFDDRIDFEPISFAWLDPKIYQGNIRRAPVRQRYQPRRANGRH